MILGEVFERFAAESPVSVMAQAVLENADALGVTRKAVYEKINRLETGLSAALVRQSSNAGDPGASRAAGFCSRRN